uniref:phosphatidylinositol-3,5-bisphosphate 3-phosphatase n=1 Tax=Romanomermis culicivorax TaxID=13658 RepID=A0A915I0V9_ROMCU
GFKELLEREWISFGHKFAERCGLLANGDPNQKAPVFLQWLDCVRYLLREFPCSFQFNEIFLLKLAQHCYSGLFGTFLCDTIRDYDIESLGHRTFSIWSYLNNGQNTSFRNFLYDDNFMEKKNYACDILIVRPQIRDLTAIWRALYCPYDDPANQHRVTSCNGSDWASAAPLNDATLTQSINHGGLPKTHSFDDLLLASMKDVKISDDAPRVHGAADNQNYVNKDAVSSPFSSLHRSTSEFTLQQQNEISDNNETINAVHDDNETKNHNSSLNQLSSSENLVEPRLNVKDRKFFYEVSQKEVKSPDGINNSKDQAANDMPKVVLDIDGMRICTDPVQQRIEEIVDGYERRIAAGRMEIERLRILIARSQENQAQDGNGVLENNKLNDTFEPGSLDSRTSEASWEAIMEDRNELPRPVLWTPDHATSRCANCRAQFWAIKRRHHCRNCGKVFCSICTNYECPVPQELLFRPVRVCIKCFERLSVEQEEGY